MGVLVSDDAGHRLRRPLHHQRPRGRAGDRLARRRRSTGCAPWSPTRAAPTSATASAASTPRAAMQSAAAEQLGVEPGQVGVASTGVIGRELPRDKVARRRARARARRWADDADDFSRGDPDQRHAAPSAPASRSSSPAGTVRLAAQAKGAGMIEPRFATMFCFVQTDAALDAETLDLLTRRVREALVRPHLAWTASSRPATRSFALANGASGRAGRARDRRRAAPRRGDGRADAPARARDRRRRRGRQSGSAGWWSNGRPGRRRAGGARGGQLAARQDRPARRRPQLRPHPAGRRAGAGRRGEPFVADLEIEGRQVVSAGDAVELRRGAGELEQAGAATRSSTCSPCPARAARPRSSSATCPEYVHFNAEYTS